MKPTVLLAACLLAAPLATSPAHAQNAASSETATRTSADFKTFLSGTSLPLTLRFKDLTADFRRVVISAQNDSFATYMQMMGAATGIEMGVYYTRGETVNIGDETYLIAYRPQMPVDAQAMRNMGHGDPVVQAKPTLNTSLSLSLLNLRTAGSFNDVRPYDIKRDIQTAAEGVAASTRTLVILGRGMRQAIHNTGEIVPHVGKSVTPELRRAFYPHVHDERTWRNPIDNTWYVPNPAISRLNLNKLTNSKYLPAFYEKEPAGDKTRGVVFLDGHVERLSPERWERFQKVKPIMRTRAAADVVSQRVRAAIAGHSQLRGAKIRVAATDTGFVYLRGTVKDESQQYAATRLATRIATDYTIANQMRIEGNEDAE